MKIDVKFDVKAFDKQLEQKLQVAAVKAYEVAVERAPAAMEGPYSTGKMRQSIRFQKTGKLEYTIFCPMPYGIYNEFGTGPRGSRTGRWVELDAKNDPFFGIKYHSGVVGITHYRDHMFVFPRERHTEGMQAQPFLRPALVAGLEWIKKLLSK